ncbi:RHS repeat-associated core domain-containing protein [Streptomyces ipomoeae]|uniref:RHS repeat-associated core domain protein n=1 Tax=Streptomyces ipomoeae 91-03 TaxID=698759 RepID=L1KMJ5_9ACTN|nr:RHS repeat-associated core domain-containing protein [Streptomyces ipomoeae]EKX61797.1 RHS repeat-associated core domain protein [Streptomyces ipomoeae 91-03]
MAALTASLLTAPVVQGAASAAEASKASRKPPVNVPAQSAGAVPRDRAEATPTKPARTVWPKAAQARVSLTGLKTGKKVPITPAGTDDKRKAAVSVGPAPATARFRAQSSRSSVPARVDVKVLDHKRLSPVGGVGLGVQVTRRDGTATAGPVQVTFDYSGFKYAYGGNFASRLRLVALPACALTTPKAKGCSPGKAKPVPVSNDVAKGTITATVQADGDPAADQPVLQDSSDLSVSRSTMATTSSATVYAVTSGSSSEAGDYRASSLKPSGSWNVSTGSGAFTYNLPIEAPRPPAGSAPSLSLSYNSQSVDAMTSSQNTQANWAGLGWELGGVGFIERRYRSCQDDGTGSGWVGDLCWDSPNTANEPDGAVYVINFNGVSSTLVQDGNGTGSYHVEDDPGWRVQHLTGGHGADDEYWVISTQDGMRYYFGWGRSERDSTATNSVLTVPVFGNDPGEPGYNGGIGVTTQAYRWGLDRVVDQSEVETAYFYDKEQNHYRSVLLTDQARPYDSAAYPVRIEYGWASQIPGAQLPARVDLNYVGRCVERMAYKDPLATESTQNMDCPAISSNPDSYPDVPTDLICDGTNADNGCKTITGETYSPTFFATKMLWDVKTFVRDDDSSPWDPAMQYQMKYGLPNPDGVVDANLWLDYVQRKGYGDGEDITLPTININGEWRDNQLGGGVLNFRRVTQIHGDLGSFVNVTYRDYDDQDACDINNPPTESNNTQACFKQRWVPEGSTTEQTGWFKKYVVAKVSVDPGPGAGSGNDGDPVMTTTYDYVGKPAWAFPNDPLTKDENESWTDWRGYQQVEVHTGTKSNAASTYYWLYRGMDGDRTSKTDPSATRSVTVDDGDSGRAPVTDSAWLRGKVLETSNRDGSGQSHQRVWHEYWVYDTAQYDGLPDARFVRESKTTTHELTSAGWREHIVKDEYDTAEPASTKYGLPLRTNDWGLSDTDDNRCTTYGRAYNTDYFPDSLVQRWMVLPDETRHYAADCASRASTNQDSYAVTLYDGATSVTANKPVDGLATAVRAYTDADHYRETTATYDQGGRQITATDAKKNTTTTTYQPATSWPVNGVKVTKPDPDGDGPGTATSSTTWYSRLWGSPYRVLDANGRTTRMVSDSVGRTVQVFRPSEIANYPSGTPSIQFRYDITVSDNSEGVPDLVSTVPPKVTTEVLQSDSTKLTNYTFTDGLGRTRETQVPAPSGSGRTVVSTRYDTSGNVTGTSAPFYNSGVAGTDGMVLPTVASLPSYTDLVIDFAGRTTESRIMVKGDAQTQGQTITGYHGDYTTTVPAAGERTNTYTDVFGQVSKVVEFGPSTYTTSYEYTRNGDLSKITDSKGNITTYTYNWLGERLTSVDPDMGTTTVAYDGNGNIDTVKNGNNAVITHKYDNLDRPVAVEKNGTVLTRRTYDTAPGGIGLQATSTSYSGGYAYTTAVTGYDVNGQPTGSQVVIPADGSGLEGTYSVGYAYDTAGHMTDVSYPATAGLPAETVTTGYDAFGLPEKVSSALATYVSATDYDALGRLTGRSYGTAATTTTTANRSYTYDDATGTGWLKNITTTTSTKGTVQNDEYVRDAGGRITDLTDKLTGQHQCYTYDELSRLSRAWTTQSTSGCAGPFAPDLSSNLDPYQLDYTYDGIGNLQKVTSTTASGSSVRDYVYPGYSADQSAYTPGAARPHAVSSVKTATGTDSYTYDDAGQMITRTVDGQTTTFLWNDLQRLVGTTGASTTSYVYDADGNLLIRKGSTDSVLYLGDQEIRKTGSGGTPKATRYYSDGGTMVAMRVAIDGGGSKLAWMMADQQASTQLAVDTATGNPARRKYLPFGAQRGSQGLPSGTDRGFLGKAEDGDTGLSFLGARMYDRSLGRFLSADPITAPYTPQNLNAYSYSGNNPVASIDPSGLFPAPSPDVYLPGPPEIKYDKGFQATIITDSQGNRYRVGEDKKARTYLEEKETRQFLNDKLKQSGKFSDGSGGGSGEEYRPVNPIKGQKRGNGTADLVRLTWEDGRLVKVTAVDIYTPDPGKTGTKSMIETIEGKANQASEVAVNGKHLTQAQAEALGKALPENLPLDAVHITNAEKDYMKTYSRADGTLGPKPPAPPKAPSGETGSGKTGTTVPESGSRLGGAGRGLLRGAGVLGELMWWYDVYEVFTGQNPCPWPSECQYVPKYI